MRAHWHPSLLVLVVVLLVVARPASGERPGASRASIRAPTTLSLAPEGFQAAQQLIRQQQAHRLQPLGGSDASPEQEQLLMQLAQAAASKSRSMRSRAKSASFDPERARLMAHLVSIAYCYPLMTEWNCTRCRQIPGFEVHLAHFDTAWDLVGYMGHLPSLNAKVIAFRGTDSSSFYNWAENMRAWRTDAFYPVPGAPRALRLHSGFNILWNASSMASTFNDAYRTLAEKHPSGPTFVLGHSMGGALAQLCAMDLATLHGAKDIRVYTFGSPRVGNSVFAEFYEKLVAESWRFTHGRDIVPSVPMTILGFHHVSREVWLVDAPAAKQVTAGVGSAQLRRLQERAGGCAAGAASGAPATAVAAAAAPGTLASAPLVCGEGDEPDERLIICDDTGEDPSCHNSACRLGLCTSVADHLVYLGVHMYGGGEC